MKGIIFLIILLLTPLALAADQTATIYSGKSGYLSRYSPSSSFASIKVDSSWMMYYGSNGYESTSGALQYEWFDLSGIPNNSIIVSATLYKYHNFALIGQDFNMLMSPRSIENTQRVTLGKLNEGFSETDSFNSLGKKYKKQTILNKIDTVSSTTLDYSLQYDVKDIVQAWNNGETNYGFSFLANDNTMGKYGSVYYFRNAIVSRPKLVIVYSVNNTVPVVCGNGIKESGEECDDGNTNSNDTCKTTCKLNICGDGLKNPSAEECDDGNLINNDGCSSACKIETVTPQSNTTYVIVYLGDIDGNVNPIWFPTYVKLVDFYHQNNIPASISFFPGTMSNDANYKDAISKIYNSGNMELIQKGYNGNETEFNYDKLTPEEQRKIAQNGQDAFKTYMNSQLSINPSPLTTYDLLGGRFTQKAINSTAAAGINFYFDIYYADDLGPVSSTPYYDVMQYDSSMTETGAAGKENKFRTTDQIINEIKNFSRNDLTILKINNYNIIPLSVHQQDFESTTQAGVIDQNKWDVYTATLLKLKQDPSIKFITPKDIHKTLHPTENPQICANKKIEGSETCDDGNLIDGDGCSSLCKTENTNAVCGNGIKESGEECDDGNLINGDACSSACKIETSQNLSKSTCQYAKSAYATSENINSEAIYATGKPDSSSPGECVNWGGSQHSWNPANWNIKANLTLVYDKPISVSNFTIIGDYDICWDRAWLKNSQTGQSLQVINGPTTNCKLTQQVPLGFNADTFILETCGWSWSSTDAVELCGSSDGSINDTTNNTLKGISICNWKDCHKGAVSVSVDDYFTSCSQQLEQNGYRGTYFLANTNTYSSSQWTEFNNLFKKGHELGTHTEDHLCSAVDDTAYIGNIQDNINDIISHTNVRQSDIITHAHPCGFTTTGISNILKNNWNFLSARGYYYNQPETADPNNFFDLKSYNSHGYPGGSYEPPNYFSEVDKAEAQGNWLNLVFHVECSDDGVINYLPTKDLWVDTIGNVVKYIKLRENSTIYDVQDMQDKILFKIKTSYTAAYYKQNITLKVEMKNAPSKVIVNNKYIAFNWVNSPQGSYTKFDVPFPINGNIEIDK
ncbi:Uncharacterised protein [uncultured archaeon]|nr:Uncharacterised protein [uncultured archaeon]